jgi:hypothetical protein
LTTLLNRTDSYIEFGFDATEYVIMHVSSAIEVVGF